MAHYEPPHQDLRCLQIQLFSFLVVKELSKLNEHYTNLLTNVAAWFTNNTKIIFFMHVRPNKHQLYFLCVFFVSVQKVSFLFETGGSVKEELMRAVTDF